MHPVHVSRSHVFFNFHFCRFIPVYKSSNIPGANIYTAFADALEKALSGKEVEDSKYDYPTVADGVRGIAFLEAVVKSSKSKEKWVKL
ncbi:MAG: hypothetical protein R6V03_03705 [Kiritimatiellia bacterium]